VNLALCTNKFHHCHQIISRPIIYENIRLTSIRQLRKLVQILTSTRDQTPKIGTWVKCLDINALSELIHGWDAIYTVLCHTTTLTELHLGPHSTPSVVAVISALPLASTMTAISLAPSQDGLYSLIYVGGLPNLSQLNVFAPTSLFQQSLGIQPWSLPRLHSITWETSPEKVTFLADFLALCRLPALTCLHILTPMSKKSAGAALARLLKGKPFVEVFTTNLHKAGYADLLAEISENLHRLVIHSPARELASHISPAITSLKLVCVNAKEDIPQIYGVLDGLLEVEDLDLDINIAFVAGSFFWINKDPEESNLPVEHSRLVGRLL
jgi:hypothetical protein